MSITVEPCCYRSMRSLSFLRVRYAQTQCNKSRDICGRISGWIYLRVGYILGTIGYSDFLGESRGRIER